MIPKEWDELNQYTPQPKMTVQDKLKELSIADLYALYEINKILLQGCLSVPRLFDNYNKSGGKLKEEFLSRHTDIFEVNGKPRE